LAEFLTQGAGEISGMLSIKSSIKWCQRIGNLYVKKNVERTSRFFCIRLCGVVINPSFNIKEHASLDETTLACPYMKINKYICDVRLDYPSWRVSEIIKPEKNY
jgi:hypothetical protein